MLIHELYCSVRDSVRDLLPIVIVIGVFQGLVLRQPIPHLEQIALGVGLAQTIRGRNPMIDGFGLIAFAALAPMIFVMASAWKCAGTCCCWSRSIVGGFWNRSPKRANSTTRPAPDRHGAERTVRQHSWPRRRAA